MYNKTGYITESWDTPTPLSYCHHWCLHWECVQTQRDTPLCNVPATGSRSAHAPAGTGMHSAVRGPHPGIQGFLRMPRSLKWWRRVTLKATPGASCLKQELNMIEFTRYEMTYTYGYVWEL